MQKQLIDAVQKIAGKLTGVEFAPDLPHAGQYDAAKKLVTLAAGKALSASTAAHEGFHVVYQHYLTPEQRSTLYKAFRQGSVKMQLKEILKDSPEAWEAAKGDPEELGAYAFQFWHAGVLKLGPETHNIFSKVIDLWNKVNDWLRNQPSAEQMLQHIADGYFADRKASPAEEALSKMSVPLRRVREVTASAFHLLDKVYDAALYPFDTRVRDMGNPHLDAIGKAMYAQVGEKTGARGLVQEIPAQTKARMNALDRIARDPSGSFSETLKQMATGKDSDATDQAMAGKIRGWLNDQHAYMRDAGVAIGHERNYIPMSFDAAKIAAQKDAFIEIFRGHQDEIDKLNAALKKNFVPTEGKSFQPLTPESIQERMASRGTATDEFLGSAYDEHGAPNADFTLNRVFGFLTNAERSQFVHDDLQGGLQRYAKQAVRRAEWSRRFGEQGEKWNAQLDKAREYGMTPEQEKLMQDYKDAAFGAKLHDMNPTLRKVLAASTVYQNYRVLGLSVLGNLIDPFGVAVRSGEWSDAFDAYKLAMGRMFKSGKLKTADLQDLAETLGTIERNGVADSISGLYGGVNIEGQLRKANDALFNYNGMNGLTRSVRLAALSAGMRFLVRHATTGEERHLNELGLKRGDVQTTPDGKLKVLESDGLTPEHSAKIQMALNRFVDEAAIHPNAGERTKWGADPIFAPLYHLKQYTFSFNKVINKKLEHELLEHGNVTPYMMAACYIPIMAASGMVRDMLTNGGSLPANNGFMHYLGSGIKRSGLMGPSDLAELAVGGIGMGDPMALRQVLGPTADQAMDAVGAIASSGGPKSFAGFVAESLPGGSFIQHYAPR